MVLDNIRKQYTLIVYVCIGIFCFCGVLGLTTFSLHFPELNHILLRFLKVIRFFLIFIVIDNLVRYGFNLKKILVFLLFLFIVAFSKNDTFELFDVLFIPFLLNDSLDYKKVYKIYFVCIIFCSVLAFCLYHLDVFSTKSFIKYELANTKMNTLGFRHPNILGFIFFLLGVLYFLIRKNITVYDSLFLLLCSFACIYLTSSRTSFIVFVGLAVFSVIYLFVGEIKEDYKKNLFYLSIIFYFSIIILFYIFSFSELGRYSFFEKYISTVADRLYMAHDVFNNYGFSWLGQKINIVGFYASEGESFFVVDCLYAYLPIAAGLIPTIIYMSSHVLAFKFTILKNDLKLLFVQYLFVIYEISEGVSYRNGLELFLFVLPLAQLFLNSKSNVNR